MNNLKILLKMATDKKVLKSLLETYHLLKDDPNFTLIKYMKMMQGILKGEKLVAHEDVYILSTFFPPFPTEAFIQNIIAVDAPIEIFTKQIYAKRTAPISMYLCVTNKCPNNCVYCSAAQRQSEQELTTEEWIKLLEDLQNMHIPIIGLTGGEPMIREDIYELLKAIDDRSVVILFTSGFNLTYERAQMLKSSGLFGIGISLDSHDKTIHNRNRNDDRAFDYALDALKNASKAGIYTMAQTVILKDQVDEESLFKLFRLAYKNGAHEVKILEPILSGNLLAEEDASKILYSTDDRKKLIAIQHKANKRNDMPKITSFAYTESEAKFGCGAGNQHSYISASGELYPCDFVPMRFGNVKDRPISELWLEMNQNIGIPKTKCFAQEVNRKVFIASDGILPLAKSDSVEICMKHRSERFPKYYRDLQK
ncbi:radical SAM/SPASM domain-containing protein [Fusibacter sp. 3D3]|uniref:radical SAM/SPASM domain-containing protein n=1 Tax=Fusibacter sp. 3D3 TaxID=1048380 RepID=UPI00085315F8|nr:radical SAM protein [Fusibacter sp. 3D3]GAU78896.1 radical SAM domain protein [Fusibacter sp. 3D3]